jgi:hypothetical protein
MKVSVAKSIKKNKKIEKEVIEYFNKKGLNVIKDNEDKNYDFLVEKNGITKKYELKTDYYISKNNDSGNMFIEYESWGRCSGICSTKSDWYVYYFYNLKEMWFIKTNELKFLIINNNIPTKDKCGDELSNTKGYLIPRKVKDIKNNFIIIDVK